MANAALDQNSRQTLTALSSVDGTTIVPLWADPTTHALLVSGDSVGTVTDVSIATANGFSGTVATSTSTPVITLKTSITGILQGNGTAISAAATTGTGSVVLATTPIFPNNITIGMVTSATGSVLLKGLTSGIVTLTTADIAGTWTMKLPTTAGTSGQVLSTDGSGTTTWSTVSSLPAGSDTQVQFNDGGSFGGDTNFTWNKTISNSFISNNLGITINTPNGVSGESIFLNGGSGSGASLELDSNNNSGDAYLYAGSSGNTILGNPGYVAIQNYTGGAKNSILDASLIVSTDKTFTFPNVAGTFSVITSSDRATAQTGAKTLTAYTVGSADSSFTVSANVLVTTATLHSFTCTVSYTDEGNTARVVTLNFSTLAGALTPTIANAGGASPYEGVPLHIRAKAATTITIATTGTFTTVTYNVEGVITQIR